MFSFNFPVMATECFKRVLPYHGGISATHHLAMSTSNREILDLNLLLSVPHDQDFSSIKPLVQLLGHLQYCPRGKFHVLRL